MGRRTVQMALMRMGAPSSATRQVGAILLSPVQKGSGSPCARPSGYFLVGFLGQGPGKV